MHEQVSRSLPGLMAGMEAVFLTVKHEAIFLDEDGALLARWAKSRDDCLLPVFQVREQFARSHSGASAVVTRP